MSIQINYKSGSLKKSSNNLILFVDEKFNVTQIRRYISSHEYSYINDLLKTSDQTKKLLVFELNSKRKIILVSIKKKIKFSDIESLGAELYSRINYGKSTSYILNSDSLSVKQENLVGYLLHGIGGWQNCLFSKCTILAIPSFRDRIPVIVDEVTTLCGPGELIDVIITERGIAINPKRKDLIKAMKNSSLPVKKIEEIKAEVDSICGGEPAKPKLNKENVVAVVKWVDGTLLDSVFQIEN